MAIRARDYFDAPGGEEAAAAVASCEEALAQFEIDALSAELDESALDSHPELGVVQSFQLEYSVVRTPGPGPGQSSVSAK